MERIAGPAQYHLNVSKGSTSPIQQQHCRIGYQISETLCVYCRWTEVARLSQSKKTFEIDTSKSSVQYVMVS